MTIIDNNRPEMRLRNSHKGYNTQKEKNTLETKSIIQHLYKFPRQFQELCPLNTVPIKEQFEV
jgi:hypothetical protein